MTQFEFQKNDGTDKTSTAASEVEAVVERIEEQVDQILDRLEETVSAVVDQVDQRVNQCFDEFKTNHTVNIRDILLSLTDVKSLLVKFFYSCVFFGLMFAAILQCFFYEACSFFLSLYIAWIHFSE